MAALFAAVTELTLLITPRPHEPLHYLIAGTCGTGVLLAIALLLWARKR